jgi:hypothetical protein
MPAWSNTDNHKNKPKFDVERETREVVQLTTANTTNSGNTVITFTYWDGTASSNLSNVIAIGYYSASTNVGANGVSGFFKSNNAITSISGNNVVLGSAVYGAIPAGTTIEFDKAIAWNSSKANDSTYNADTVLVTPTRLANNTVSMGNIVPGWVNITKSKNGGADGAVRYRLETLVALANPTAANTNSGNTGWGQAFTGV